MAMIIKFAVDCYNKQLKILEICMLGKCLASNRKQCMQGAKPWLFVCQLFIYHYCFTVQIQLIKLITRQHIIS